MLRKQRKPSWVALGILTISQAITNPRQNCRRSLNFSLFGEPTFSALCKSAAHTSHSKTISSKTDIPPEKKVFLSGIWATYNSCRRGVHSVPVWLLAFPFSPIQRPGCFAIETTRSWIVYGSPGQNLQCICCLFLLWYQYLFSIKRPVSVKNRGLLFTKETWIPNQTTRNLRHFQSTIDEISFRFISFNFELDCPGSFLTLRFNLGVLTLLKIVFS